MGTNIQSLCLRSQANLGFPTQEMLSYLRGLEKGGERALLVIAD